MTDRGQAPDILHVITTTTARGAERFAVELAAALERRGRRGRVVALTAGTGDDAVDVPTLGPSRLGPRTLRELRRLARRARVVVAHGSTTLPATAMATLGSGTPFVYRNIGDPTYWSATGLRRLRTTVLLARADTVVALTDGTAAALRELHHLGAGALTVIPQATSTDAFPLRTEETRRAARAELGLTAGDRLAVAVGALSPEKDLPTAVRALSHLPERWRLVIAGDGPERPAVEAAATGLGDRVRLLGRISDPGRLMTAADVLVLPSRTEGLPGVLIEAAMVGVPAVATDVGYVSDIVDDGTTGLIVEPGDPQALARAIERGEDRFDRMGAAAHGRVVDRYSFDRVVAQWDDVLTGILGAPDRPHQPA